MKGLLLFLAAVFVAAAAASGVDSMLSKDGADVYIPARNALFALLFRKKQHMAAKYLRR